MKIILWYVIIGLTVSAWNGNLDTKYSDEQRIKSVLYWPTFAINYYNARSKVNQVDEEKLKELDRF